VRQLRQFVTDASHELRTPIAVLHGETELLLSKPRTRRNTKKHSPFFDDELKKLTRMVEGLFTLSIADAGQLHVESEPLYINEVFGRGLRAGLLTREKKGNCHPAPIGPRASFTPATRRFYISCF